MDGRLNPISMLFAPAVLILSVLMLSALPAVARISGLELLFPTESEMPPIVYDEIVVKFNPLVIDRAPADDTVRFNLYYAEGRQSDRSKFRVIGTLERGFHYRGFRGLDSLNHSGFALLLENHMKAMPAGLCTIFLTAIDDDGESPPSHTITFELLPIDENLFARPELLSAERITPGAVRLRLAPVRKRNWDNALIFFLIFRAEGVTSEFDSTFTLLRQSDGAVPNALYYETADTLGNGDLLLTILGVKRGMASYAVQYSEAWDVPQWRTAPSRIVTIDAGGAEPGDHMLIYHDVAKSAGVVPPAPSPIPAGIAWPNPAVESVRLGTTLGDGPALLHVVDAAGGYMHTERAVMSGGACELDVRSLAAGAYFAVIARGAERTVLRFVVRR